MPVRPCGAACTLSLAMTMPPHARPVHQCMSSVTRRYEMSILTVMYMSVCSSLSTGKFMLYGLCTTWQPCTDYPASVRGTEQATTSAHWDKHIMYAICIAKHLGCSLQNMELQAIMVFHNFTAVSQRLHPRKIV